MNLLKRSAAMIIFIGGVASGFAQQMPPVPTDPNVRVGKLENGLTYYIRHNELPENQADFYIAQKVGSILEEDNQRERTGSLPGTYVFQRNNKLS